MREKTMLVAKERNKWAADEIKRECLEHAVRLNKSSVAERDLSGRFP